MPSVFGFSRNVELPLRNDDFPLKNGRLFCNSRQSQCDGRRWVAAGCAHEITWWLRARDLWLRCHPRPGRAGERCFILKNDDFTLKHDGFILRNDEFLIQIGAEESPAVVGSVVSWLERLLLGSVEYR